MTEEWELKIFDIAIDSEKYPATHTLIHKIIFIPNDINFNHISQNILVWNGFEYDEFINWIPVNETPKVDLEGKTLKNGIRYNKGKVIDVFDKKIPQLLKERKEIFSVISIPYEAIFENNFYSNKMPGDNESFNLTYNE